MTTSFSDAHADGQEQPATTTEREHDAGTELDVLLVGTFGGGGVHQYIEEQRPRLAGRLSVTLHDMGMPPEGSGIRWFLRGVLLGLVAMARFPLRRPPDVVHLHTSHRYSFYRAAFYALYARYVWNVPVVLHVHGSSFDEFVTSASPPVATLQSIVFDAATDIVALSEYWKDILAERADPAKIQVLPNAVDVDSFPADPSADPPRIVFVSNLHERKGVRELVSAIETLLAQVADPVEVDIAGDGPLSGPVERLAENHEAVTYHGYVSEERKRELLANGSIYVLPAYAEGLPIALLEGMAAANAVVSTPVGAIPEVIDEENGRLVPAGDADALADALVELVTAPETQQSMAETNRDLAAERYDWDQVIDDLEALYRSRARV